MAVMAVIESVGLVFVDVVMAAAVVAGLCLRDNVEIICGLPGAVSTKRARLDAGGWGTWNDGNAEA